MAIKARSAKAKGARLEKATVEDLRSLGIEAGRQPGSGVYANYPKDVHATIRGNRYLFECKARASPPKTLERWLAGADFLVVRADRAPPRVYMTWDMFKELCK